MRLLYLQHVDWDWLPQRPHFLAAALASRGHEVRVRYIRAHRRTGLLRSGLSTSCLQDVSPVVGVPKWDRLLARTIDGELLRRAIDPLLDRRAVDGIWVSHPRWWPAVASVGSMPIIYDRMDDPVAMSACPRYVRSLENDLIQRADVLVASSPALKNSSGRDDALEVRNAARDDVEWPALRESVPSRVRSGAGTEPRRVLFFGTIGRWLDFEVLERLAESTSVDLRLIGPIRCPLSTQLRRCVDPTMTHEALMTLASEWADCLILPFVQDSFAETVDPVKLYEYVALWKPILSPPLKVLELARAFIETYEGVEDVLEALERADTRPLPEHREFVLGNTWEARAAAIDVRLAQL